MRGHGPFLVAAMLAVGSPQGRAPCRAAEAPASPCETPAELTVEAKAPVPADFSGRLLLRRVDSDGEPITLESALTPGLLRYMSRFLRQLEREPQLRFVPF